MSRLFAEVTVLGEIPLLTLSNHRGAFPVR